ncbi:MAG: V-type ATPase subunit [Angelakisella sp.]
MLKSYSSKAIASKARAMYGQRLTAADYNDMVKKDSVTEVALYLRDNTHYHQALNDLSLDGIHRAQLEERLRGARFGQYGALTRYCFSRKAGFYQYLYLLEETEQLLKLLRYIGGGSEGEYFFSHTKELPRYCTYNLNAVLAARDYPTLLAAVAGTPYKKILEKYPPRSEGGKNQIDLVLCERDLKVHYYDQLFSLIDEEFSHGAAQELKDIFLARIDAENLVNAYRLRYFFRSEPDYIRQVLLPYRTGSHKLIDKIIDCTENKELPGLLRTSAIVRHGSELDQDYIEGLTARTREKVSRRALRYSTYPAVTLVSYMTQMDIELDNVINIIEGIRYGLPEPDLRKLLILVA